MIELTSKQRKLLEKNAQGLNSVVIVGQNGVTSAVVSMADATLAAHELIKVSFNDFKDEKKELAAKLADECGATLVRIIGSKVILYRPAEKAADRKFEKALGKL
jgi:Predicted RNA-binding protein containing KH domain, possibly ribosomal protein